MGGGGGWLRATTAASVTKGLSCMFDDRQCTSSASQQWSLSAPDPYWPSALTNYYKHA